MGASYKEARLLPVDINYCVGKLRAINTSGLKIKYGREQQIPNGASVFLSTNANFLSWGESITVNLTAQGNQTVVDIFSECSLPTQIVDYGKNKDNVYGLFSFIMQGAPVNQQPVAPQPQQPAADPQHKVCPVCGKTLGAEAVFCSGCGTKLS